MSYRLGKNSLTNLATCHIDLDLIIKESIAISDVDFGVSEGHRSVEDQQRYFREGKSKIDGITQKSKHNYSPSMAVDIFPVIEGKANFDNEHISYLAGIICATAGILYRQGKVSHVIRWGGNWDMDGTILIDQSFDDRPHFELIKPAV